MVFCGAEGFRGIAGIDAGYRLQTQCPGRRTRSWKRVRSRWHLGSVPFPGHPLRLGHVHARLPVPALERSEVDRRRRVDPAVPARHRCRVRTRSQDPVRPPRDRRGLVEQTSTWTVRSRSKGRKEPRTFTAGSCSRAAATTGTTTDTPPSFRASNASTAPSSTRRSGPKIWTTGTGAVVVIGSGADRGDDGPRDGEGSHEGDDAATVTVIPARGVDSRMRWLTASTRCCRDGSRAEWCGGRTCSWPNLLPALARRRT